MPAAHQAAADLPPSAGAGAHPQALCLEAGGRRERGSHTSLEGRGAQARCRCHEGAGVLFCAGIQPVWLKARLCSLLAAGVDVNLLTFPLVFQERNRRGTGGKHCTAHRTGQDRTGNGGGAVEASTSHIPDPLGRLIPSVISLPLPTPDWCGAQGMRFLSLWEAIRGSVSRTNVRQPARPILNLDRSDDCSDDACKVGHLDLAQPHWPPLLL